VNCFLKDYKEVEEMTLNTKKYDVVVIGAGNAALNAALAAHNEGAKVLVLEWAPQELRGGNTYFTSGGYRVSYGNAMDVIPKLIPDITKAEMDSCVIPPYTHDNYYNTVMRLCKGRTDPDLLELIVRESLPTILWMKEQGVKWELNMTFTQKSNDKIFFAANGMVFQTKGAGAGLSDTLFDILRQRDIELLYGSKATNLLVDSAGKVYGVGFRTKGEYREVKGKAVVLGCGGFESNPEMRVKYLGKDWDIIKVRGTRFNTGVMLKAALDMGAAPTGHFAACHNTFVDANAPQPAIRKDAESTRRVFHPLCILVNNQGKRFVDEGEDFSVYTYARAGIWALSQPDAVAYQIFDSKVTHLLEGFYSIPQASRVESNSIKELEGELGLPSNSLIETVNKYNEGVQESIPFNHIVLDGKKSVAEPVKSNWAQKIDTPPYLAYPVTCGITFTFGGVKINLKGQVLDATGEVIPGLYACGEIVGGIFYYNYPGAGGLTNGAVLGRIAGSYAASGG
jgi:tricarballylate dehydrogenase